MDRIERIRKKEQFQEKLREMAKIEKEYHEFQTKCKHEIAITYTSSSNYATYYECECVLCGGNIKKYYKSLSTTDFEKISERFYFMPKDERKKFLKNIYKKVIEKYPNYSDEEIIEETKNQIKNRGEEYKNLLEEMKDTIWKEILEV